MCMTLSALCSLLNAVKNNEDVSRQPRVTLREDWKIVKIYRRLLHDSKCTRTYDGLCWNVIRWHWYDHNTSQKDINYLLKTYEWGPGRKFMLELKTMYGYNPWGMLKEPFYGQSFL